MIPSVYVFDPTAEDEQSRVRGVGRYLQLLKENFHQWVFTSNLAMKQFSNETIFINPFFNFLQPPLLMKRVAKKQIAVIHDLIPLKYPEHFPAGIRGNLNIFLNKLALNNYDLIVTDSETSKKDIVQILKIDESRVRVIYPTLPEVFIESKLKTQNLKFKTKTKNLKTNISKILDLRFGFDIEDLTFELGDRYCLYVGDATWNKNLVNLARAIKIINVPCVFVGKVFDRAVGGVSEVTLRLHSAVSYVGQGSYRSLPFRSFSEGGERRNHERQNLPQLINIWQKEFKEFVEETKDDKRFIIAGYISDYKLIKLYQQSKVNVLVSRDEGFGFSYLEAANFSCPSVLSNIPVLREISDGKGAYFANPNDPNDIANKIGEIYFNPDLRKKLAFEAQQQASRFNQAQFKKNWLSCFK